MTHLLRKVGLMIIIMIVIATNMQAQSYSEYALIQRMVFNNPPTNVLHKAATNQFWGIDLFANPRATAESYVISPTHDILSIAGFLIDQDWDRMVYYDYTNNWIKAYGGGESRDVSFYWPRSIAALAPCDGVSYENNYNVYVLDTENNRVVKLQYNWIYQWLVYAGEITAGGLTRPIDLALNNNLDFYPSVNDYLWVLDGTKQLKRITWQGWLMQTYGTYGCSGNPGEFCRPVAVVSGRDAFLSEPNDRFADNDEIYIADADMQKIIWLHFNYASESIDWIKSVATSPTIVDMEVDNFGHVWAIDRERARITKYSSELFPLCTFGSMGIGENQFIWPVSISNVGGYLGLGNMYIGERWTDSSGYKHFVIGTDIVDFDAATSGDECWHHISYVLVDPSLVTIQIKNGSGTVVKTLFDGAEFSGYCSHIWDGSDDSNERAPTGDYTITVYDTSSYWGILSNEPVNTVIKETTVHHVYCASVECIPGDANGDGGVNVGDAVYIIRYVFGEGPPPLPYQTCSGDANGDCTVNVGDAVYIISYIFKDGTPPVDGSTWLASCGDYQ